MGYSRVARNLRERIAGFSGELSKGLPKTAGRFVREMVYGIQAGQSVVLTKIGRTLEEEVSIKKVQERLCRQLMRDGLGDTVQRNLLKMASGLVGRDTLLVPDPTDIRKKYAGRMEFLAGVPPQTARRGKARGHSLFMRKLERIHGRKRRLPIG